MTHTFVFALLFLSLCKAFTPYLRTSPFGVLTPSVFPSPPIATTSAPPSSPPHKSPYSTRPSLSLNLFGKKNKNDDAGDAESSSDTGDILNSPAFLSKKVEVLEKELKEAEADLSAAVFELDAAKEEWASQMDRLNGEYGAVKSRAFNATRDASKKATVKVVKEVLQVMDNFERAFTSVKCESEEAKEVEACYREIHAGVEAVFLELGVTAVETVGEEFDFERHEAIMQQPGTDYEEGIVCQEFQKGYMMEDELIRPAMVAVAL